MIAQTSGIANVFGDVRFGYVLIESRKIGDWKRFLGNGLGMHCAHADSSSLAYRMDEHARRVIVRRGPAEDVVATGWHLRDEQTLANVVERLKRRKIDVETGSNEEAAFRGVTSFVRIKGPKGIAIELFTDPLVTYLPLNMLTSGFITGASGMGHMAITTRLPEKMLRFFQEIFDARLSDTMSQPLGGVMLDVAFLRVNERHHTIAIASTRGLRLDPIRTRVQHINMQVSTLEDLSAAFKRLKDLGYKMAHEIGQHPNDRELSFYVIAPSGFEIELGWNPIVVNEETWRESFYNAISAWGHKPPNNSLLNKSLENLGNLRRGLRALLKPEYSPL